MDNSKKKHLVFLTGAGISQESGISTFRDQNGLWENHKIEEVASPEGFAKNPQLVLDFYNARWQQLQTVLPNSAHYAIAALEKQYKVTVITQNVDDLHERAGSTNMIHLHGELTKCRSSINQALCYPYSKPIRLGDLAEDGSQLRPHIVWFGEAVPEMENAATIVRSADVFVIVGTSLMVYPAASLHWYVPKNTRTIYIDTSPENVDGIDNLTIIKEKATTGIKKLIESYLPEFLG